jgi:hypothetical protein
MVRILRAFVWLRWRTLLNSLERRTSRDTLERFSIAIEQLAPTIAALVMLPSMAGLAGVAGYTGFSLAHGEVPSLGWAILRALLLGTCGLAVIGPILMPGGDRTNAVRLLLLPIPRSVLYLGHVIGALADPWVLLATAVVVGLPLGFAAGGNVTAAALAAVAGVILLAVLVGIALTVTNAVHLLVRDRRRGELLALIAVIVLPMMGMLPELLDRGRHRGDAIDAPAERPTSAIERRLMASIPSELYVHSMRPAPGAGLALTPVPVAGLAAFAVAAHLLAFLTFTRILGSPDTTGRQRQVGSGAAVRWRIPGTSSATSAVARNQLRLAFRSPRGRATMVSPLAVFLMFTILNLRGRGDGSFLTANGGVGMAAFSTFFSLLALLPLAMNQFAIDRAGLILTMLAPIETMTLLRGKAIGNAAIAAIPGVVCFTAAVMLFPGGDPALWLCIPLTMIGAYIVAAPIAAILSAVFPRPVDLNSIGRGSNAHGAAGLLGMLTFVAATAPGALLTILTRSVLHRPALAPLVVAGWIAIAAVLSLLLFKVAGGVYERRRENLALTSRANPT